MQITDLVLTYRTPVFCATVAHGLKYNIGLKTLLQQGISEPISYGDLVYKFKKNV